jgi:hypothetical protein
MVPEVLSQNELCANLRLFKFSTCLGLRYSTLPYCVPGSSVLVIILSADSYVQEMLEGRWRDEILLYIKFPLSRNKKQSGTIIGDSFNADTDLSI